MNSSRSAFSALPLTLSLLALSTAPSLPAADVVKANNTTALNQAGSYVSGGPPGSSDVVVVNSIMAGNKSVLLGGNLSVSGIRYDSDAGGGLTINNTAGASLSLGTSGISILTTTSGRDLTINCNLALTGNQTWNMSSRNLSLGGSSVLTDNGNSLAISGTNTLTFGSTASQTIGASMTYTAGAVNFSGGAIYTLTNNQSQIVAVSVTGNSTVRASDIVVTTGKGTLGGGSFTMNNGAFEYTGSTAASSQAFSHDSRADYSRIDVTTAGQTLTLSSNLNTTATASTNNNNAWELGGAGNLTVNGVIANSTTGANPVVAVKKIGAGTLTLSGNNTYTGLTDVQNGTLVLNRSGGTLANTAPVQVSGGTLNIAQSDTVGTVTVSSGSITGAGTLTGTSFAFSNSGSASAVLAGTGGLTKSGGGTVTLSGANTYTGATAVTSGTLIVNGSLAAGSTVTVDAGATVGGSGTINGPVTMNGSLAPGNSIGNLTVANDVTWNGSIGQNWKFELGVVTGSNDKLTLTGAGNDFLKGSGSLFEFDLLNTGVAGTFTLVDWADTATTSFSAGDFSYVNLASGLNGTFAINGSQLDLTISSVPEPSATAFFLLGLGLFGTLRRSCKARI